jgi:hypothetical protein
MILLDEFLLNEWYIYSIFIWCTLVTLGILGFYFYTKELAQKIKALEQKPAFDTNKANALDKQIFFAERIALKNLTSRVHVENTSLVNAMLEYNQNINAEYQNIVPTQTATNPDLWKALTDYKDQNTIIINELAKSLPSTATGTDLQKAIATLMATPGTDMSTIILDALRYERNK